VKIILYRYKDVFFNTEHGNNKVINDGNETSSPLDLRTMILPMKSKRGHIIKSTEVVANIGKFYLCLQEENQVY